jgi:DNA-binding LacI/PurR family transcriptional regulator
VNPRVTQRRIAELAGVSQTTVSLVLNGKDDAGRIPESTRQRVLEVIEETTYVADPAARRLAGQANNLVGIFTYEHAFPTQTSDFYTPLLTGIESEAEQLGLDLLMFTSAPIVDGRRRILHERSRLRLADGCLLLGRVMDVEELERLSASGYPFVAVGRREVEDVNWVGVDYTTASETLANRVLQAGHRSAVYAHLSLDAESSRDRHDATVGTLAVGGARSVDVRLEEVGLTGVFDLVEGAHATVLMVEDPGEAEILYAEALRRGIRVPDDLSFVVLGERLRAEADAPDFARLVAPRVELGAAAVAALHRLLNDDAAEPVRELLPCSVIDGTTLSEVGAR